jgi:hypothetical protein
MKRTLTLLALLVAGCGGSDPAQPYVGTWSFTSGSDNVSCPNGASSAKLTGNLTIKPSTGDGDLVVLDPEGCNFTYAVDTAAARTSARMCSFPVPELGQGVTAAATYDTITLTTSDGKSMNDTFSGSVVYTASSGQLNCVFSGTATLSKVSQQ